MQMIHFLPYSLKRTKKSVSLWRLECQERARYTFPPFLFLVPALSQFKLIARLFRVTKIKRSITMTINTKDLQASLTKSIADSKSYEGYVSLGMCKIDLEGDNPMIGILEGKGLNAVKGHEKSTYIIEGMTYLALYVFDDEMINDPSGVHALAILVPKSK